jgi:hypothetical protein
MNIISSLLHHVESLQRMPHITFPVKSIQFTSPSPRPLSRFFFFWAMIGIDAADGSLSLPGPRAAKQLSAQLLSSQINQPATK